MKSGRSIDRCDANDPVVIPRLLTDDWDHNEPGPGWYAVTSGGKPAKPLVKCKCGTVTGIGLHHVYADGRVMQSYFDSPATSFEHGGKTYTHPAGCGWHVYIKLGDYDQGEFPPDKRDE